jgi:glycerol-3-phosphate acyltransferase PlsY
VATITIAIGAVIIIATDTVSAGSISGVVVSVLLTWLLGDPRYLPYVVVGAAVVIVQHRDNIARLLAGNERRLGLRAKVLGLFHPHGP